MDSAAHLSIGIRHAESENKSREWENNFSSDEFKLIGYLVISFCVLFIIFIIAYSEIYISIPIVKTCAVTNKTNFST